MVARRSWSSPVIWPRGAPLLNDPVPFEKADAVIMESTYGDRDHRSLHETAIEGRQIIARAIENEAKSWCRCLPSGALSCCSIFWQELFAEKLCHHFRFTLTVLWRSQPRDLHQE
jgi:hypothetical protein